MDVLWYCCLERHWSDSLQDGSDTVGGTSLFALRQITLGRSQQDSRTCLISVYNSLNNGPLRQGSHESSKFLIVMQYPSDSFVNLGLTTWLFWNILQPAVYCRALEAPALKYLTTRIADPAPQHLTSAEIAWLFVLIYYNVTISNGIESVEPQDKSILRIVSGSD